MLEIGKPGEEGGFKWIDAQSASRTQLAEIARECGFHFSSVTDCLDPGHLPKYERQGDTVFVIMRVYLPDRSRPDTVRHMTRKLAYFYRPGLLITVHRSELPFLEATAKRWDERGKGGAHSQLRELELITELLHHVLTTYRVPLDREEQLIERFEARVFNRPGGAVTEHMHRVHVSRRRVGAIKRLMLHTHDVLSKINPSLPEAAPLLQDLRETAHSLFVTADELRGDVDEILQIQLSLASHRTNEVMRVLTVFSAFFLPLTFIVGVYGMNFEHMPEIKWRFGYAAAWALMIAITAAIALWFKHRGWWMTGSSESAWKRRGTTGSGSNPAQNKS